MKTLADAAEELGVTKSTVSRALSGRGRVGEETKKRVQEWVKQNKYTPNSIARSLAESRTYNIAVVLPENADNIFFQQCLIGIAEAIVRDGYDAVVVIDYGDDISSLERVIRNQKVDGVILTRSVQKDKIARFLKREGFPFIVIGTSADKKLYQIDADHRKASCELTYWLLQTGARKVALLGGSEDYLVNKRRYEGFKAAFAEEGIPFSDGLVVWNVWTDTEARMAKVMVPLFERGIDAVACMDDAICQRAIIWLRNNGYRVPEDVRLVSFYDGKLLDSEEHPVSAVAIDTAVLSQSAGRMLIDLLREKDVPRQMEIPYTIKIRNK